MARSRRGSFGLQPRVVPNVTAQIVALAREYVAKRDSLIMDAWRNGGTFEGKKADDDMVLAYWKERMDGLDHEDPNYEQAKDEVFQLTYAVEQSKMDLLHLQNKITTMEYAQFFLKWAKKAPKGSEFYRTLQKDAAQLIEQAKTQGRADAERAKTESFNAFVKTTTEHDIAIGDALTRDLDALSKRTGLNVTANGDELLDLLTKDVKANPDAHRALLDTIAKSDAGWDGQLTPAYFSEHIKGAVQGYNAIADLAQKDGFMSAYANATEGMTAMTQWGQNVQVWPVAQTYSDLENSFLKVWNNPNVSQMDKMAASNAFSQSLIKLSGTPGIDAGSKTMIEADAQRLLGQDAGDNPSFGIAMLGRPGVDPKMAMQLGAWYQLDAEMKANPLAFSYGPVDENGQYDPTGKGPLGIVPAGAVPPGAQAVMVPGAKGQAVLAMVMPHSVYTTDPNNPTASPKLAGYQLAYSIGGRNIKLWGYRDNSGGVHWSLTSPLSEGTSTEVDKSGDVFVTPKSSAATDPIARAAQLDAQLGTHIADQLKAQQAQGAPLGNVSVSQNTIDSKTGKVTGSIDLKYDNGVFTATQTQNTYSADGKDLLGQQKTPIDIAVNSPEAAAFSQSRLTAGDVPGTTFTSPMEASVRAASYTQTQDQISRFAADPAFQQAFLSQTMQTLGAQSPYDPRIASAWKSLMTPAVSTSGLPPSVGGAEARHRKDLSYPGTTPQAGYDRALTIHFGGGQELRLPGLPNYMKNQTFDGAGVKGAYDFANGLLGNILPGLGAPPQQGQGSPTPSVTPMPTPTAMTTDAIPTDIAKPPSPSPSPSPSYKPGNRPV